MRKIALAFAAASFSGLGGMDATAAPAFWQGAWGIRHGRQSRHLQADVKAVAIFIPHDAGYRVTGDSIDLALFK